MSKSKILIIEDEEYNRQFYSDILSESHFFVRTSPTLADGDDAIREMGPDLILLDLKFDRDESDEGLFFLQRIRKEHPDTEVIVISGSRRDSTKITAILNYGAFDYLEKPIRRDVLLLVVNRALERIRLYRENEKLKKDLARAQTLGFHGMITVSPKMHTLFERIKKIAALESTVLITGETGTGKELVARAIHEQSGRSPLMAIDLGTLSTELAGSELFGHTKGSFTGALGDRKGKIEAAGSGTVFLDEIENISLDVQQKLLRLLEEKNFQRIGSNITIKTDSRFIVATNVDLQQKVKTGEFRQDLYHRLNVINLHIPPLRERPEDIEPLTRFFQSIHSKSLDIYKRISPAALEKLSSYHWPGNVRELKNAIEEALIFGTDENELLPDDFSLDAQQTPKSVPQHKEVKSLKHIEIEAKKTAIRNALAASNDVIAKAARLLEITPRHLRRLLDEYNLD